MQIDDYEDPDFLPDAYDYRVIGGCDVLTYGRVFVVDDDTKEWQTLLVSFPASGGISLQPMKPLKPGGYEMQVISCGLRGKQKITFSGFLGVSDDGEISGGLEGTGLA